MADFEFEITSGPYQGRYDLELADFTAAEATAFRHALGLSIAQVVNDGSADVDAVAGLVWLVRRRGAKSLPYAAVADSITYGNVAALDAAAAAAGEESSVDPTTPAGSDAD